MRPALIWAGLALLLFVPLILAAQSPLLQWRDTAYIAGGFAGIIGLCLMLLQPLLAAQALPLHPLVARRVHRWSGIALVVMVVVHIGGLWITSPPDVVDVLLFRSPTPFGIWGALAMWAVMGGALAALFRKRLSLRVWRRAHLTAVMLAIAATVPHALLIEGAMHAGSKAALCTMVVVASVLAFYQSKFWR